MLNITVYVAYLSGMFFVVFLGPICNAQMPNINVSANVNNTELKPKTNPDNNVININAEIVFLVLKQIQLVTDISVLELDCMFGFFVVSESNI